MRRSVMIGATIVAAVILSASLISVKGSMAQGISISPAPGVHIGIGHHHHMGYPVEHHHHHYGGGSSYYGGGHHGEHDHYYGGGGHNYYAYGGGKRKNKPQRGD